MLTTVPVPVLRLGNRSDLISASTISVSELVVSPRTMLPSAVMFPVACKLPYNSTFEYKLIKSFTPATTFSGPSSVEIVLLVSELSIVVKPIVAVLTFIL